METTPTADCFDAHTVELYPDVRDTILGIRSGEGSTVRFYNSAEEEFMELFQPLLDEKPGVCATRKTAGCTRS